MRLLSVLFVFSLMASISCATAHQIPREEDAFETIIEKFVEVVALGWDSFSLCENRERSERNSYLKLLFPPSELSQGSRVKGRHFVVQQQTKTSGVDLSIYRIQFSSEDVAKKVFARKLNSKNSGSIADGKVLTKYATKLSGSEIIVLRSQSFLDPVVSSFLESFTKRTLN